MKKPFASLLTLWLAFVPVQALADSTINNLSAGSALTGGELIPMFQGSNPAVTTTPNALKTFIGGGPPGGTNGQIQYNNSGSFGGLTPAIATGCGATGGTIGNSLTGTIAASQAFNLQTGTNYAIVSTDCGKLVDLSNASNQTPTIAQAGTTGFAAGYYVDVCNIGAGTQTITPATSTINGAASYTLGAGNGTTPVCVRVVSDGTNYQIDGGAGGGITTLTANSTSTSGFTAGQLLMSDGSKLQVAGAAKATSLALGGATIGSDALGITGTATISGLLTSGTLTTGGLITSGGGVIVGSSNTLSWNSSRGILSSPAAATIQFGGANVASPVAQTAQAQGSRSGTDSNVAGANFTIESGNGTGNATPSTLSFASPVATTSGTGAQTQTIAAQLSSGLFLLPNIGSDATHTDATVCEDTTTHALYSGSGTLGVCLGTSSRRFKHNIKTINVGLDEVMKLKPVSFFMNPKYGDPDKKMYGFIAEDAVSVLPSLTGHDASGQPSSFDYVGVIPVLVKALQEQQAEIAELKRKLR